MLIGDLVLADVVGLADDGGVRVIGHARKAPQLGLGIATETLCKTMHGGFPKLCELWPSLLDSLAPLGSATISGFTGAYPWTSLQYGKDVYLPTFPPSPGRLVSSACSVISVE